VYNLNVAVLLALCLHTQSHPPSQYLPQSPQPLLPRKRLPFQRTRLHDLPNSSKLLPRLSPNHLITPLPSTNVLFPYLAFSPPAKVLLPSKPHPQPHPHHLLPHHPPRLVPNYTNRRCTAHRHIQHQSTGRFTTSNVFSTTIYLIIIIIIITTQIIPLPLPLFLPQNQKLAHPSNLINHLPSNVEVSTLTISASKLCRFLLACPRRKSPSQVIGQFLEVA